MNPSPSQYGTNANLRARYRLYRYTTRPNHFVHWAPEQIAWTGDEVVLDVGCGDGDYLLELGTRFPRMTLCGIDVSTGMVRAAHGRAAPARCRWVAGDLLHLPVRPRSADVVMAMHMLYHVEDITRAVRNLSLAVKESGVVLVGCNALAHLEELRAAFARSAQAVTGAAPAERARATARFGAHNAERLLSTAFGTVERRTLRDHLVLPAVEPVVGYLASMRASYGSTLRDSAAFDEVLAHVQATLERQLDRDGQLRIRTESALFLASGPRPEVAAERADGRDGERAWV